MTKPLHIAHFQLYRDNGAFLIYRLEGSGHVILIPKHWLPWDKPPKDISIEIRDRQISLLDAIEEAQ